MEKRLWQAEFVYIRRGNVLGPFQSPYYGLFKVIDCQEKVFDIQVGGRIENVSVDRIKPHMGAVPLSPASRCVGDHLGQAAGPVCRRRRPSWGEGGGGWDHVAAE
jgi:hypothetical protein